MPVGLVVGGLLAACAGAATRPPSTRAGLVPTDTVTEQVAATEPVEYLAAGGHERIVTLDGQKRRWMTIVPPSDAGAPATGAVIVLHGVGGRGPDMRPTVALEPLASPEGVVLVFPDAVGGAWNDGRPGADAVVAGVTVDDVRFLRLVIEETVARTGAPPARVAVVGFSAGAVMASRLACDAADRVSAMVLVGGSAGQGFQDSCRPARPVATMLVAGSADPTVPYGGGRVADWGTRKRGFVAPVEDVFAFWSAQGGCGPVTLQAALGPAAVVSEARAAGCRAGTAVVRVKVNGGGHEWFRDPRFDTTGAAWQFVWSRFATATAVPATPTE